MDVALRRSMLRYYDERASEYEEAYTRGTGTSSIADPTVFTSEIAELVPIVARSAAGRLLDLACGTAHWLPHYATRCSEITLFDQSPRMLDEARRKSIAAGAADRCTMICGDVFDAELPAGSYDTILAGFFVSHLTEDQESPFFEMLKQALAPGGRFVLLDSAWTPERARVNAKVERQARRLNDGTAFEIYKRYLDRDDTDAWVQRHGITLRVEHLGRAFLAVTGAWTD